MLRLSIPVLHVSRSEAARDFYCGRLGFQVEFTYRPRESEPDPCYMGVSREGTRLHLSSFSGDGVPGGVVYVAVDRVDALHAEFVGRGVPIDTGPVNQTWGNREMYVNDPDGNSLRFTQEGVPESTHSGLARDEEAASSVRSLYEAILGAWNRRDAAAMSAPFTEDASMVGFDGSQVDGRAAIESHLKPIFSDHPTAAYVARLREIRSLAPDVVLLRAVAGMVPPGSSDLNPSLNTIQTLVARRAAAGWRVTLFQSTPAAWHGRPADSAALTEELREVLRRGVTLA